MTKFEKIKIGERAEIKHIVTQQDLEQFVSLTGDDNKLHIDKNFAAKTIFKKPVVHGMLGASFISTIIGTKLPGDGSLWFSQSLEFLLPVRIGDELTIKAEVTKKTENLQVIELQTDIYNQDKQKVTTGIAKVKVIEEEVAAASADAAVEQQRKLALVIGATGGIGRKTCLSLAKEGFDLIIHYHSSREIARKLQEEVEKMGIKAETVSGDITNENEIRNIVELIERKFGYLTVMINCATSKIANIKFMDLEWSDMQKHIDINLKGNYFLIRHCVSLFDKRKYGKIVLMSTQAVETPNAEWLPYITAKSGLQGFGKALAVELSVRGVRVNIVSAGMTETDLIANIPEKIRLVTAAKTPLRRLASPDDIASAIVFLASEKSDFITGETIRINGGQVMI